ncbi:hypothetical protein K438DRAFT_2066660 [Mycena galopus ATCC 62051]|nr:hypothetical protein K438DRAFT_2066660 [Mycena galopus ATCC 62051]
MPDYGQIGQESILEEEAEMDAEKVEWEMALLTLRQILAVDRPRARPPKLCPGHGDHARAADGIFASTGLLVTRARSRNVDREEVSNTSGDMRPHLLSSPAEITALAATTAATKGSTSNGFQLSGSTSCAFDATGSSLSTRTASSGSVHRYGAHWSDAEDNRDAYGRAESTQPPSMRWEQERRRRRHQQPAAASSSTTYGFDAAGSSVNTTGSQPPPRARLLRYFIHHDLETNGWIQAPMCAECCHDRRLLARNYCPELALTRLRLDSSTFSNCRKVKPPDGSETFSPCRKCFDILLNVWAPGRRVPHFLNHTQISRTSQAVCGKVLLDFGTVSRVVERSLSGPTATTSIELPVKGCKRPIALTTQVKELNHNPTVDYQLDKASGERGPQFRGKQFRAEMLSAPDRVR